MIFVVFCEMLVFAYCIFNIYRSISSFPMSVGKEQNQLEEIKLTLRQLPMGQRGVLLASMLIAFLIHIATPILLIVFCWSCSEDADLSLQVITTVIATITALIATSELGATIAEGREASKKLLILNQIDTVAQILCQTVAGAQVLYLILENFIV